MSFVTSPTESPDQAQHTCIAILQLLLPFRRAAETEPVDHPEAFGEQLRQLAQFVAKGEPILFTLPAFPCKSPNPAKVFGHLPDEGERLSLHFLNDLCARVGEIYRPGARLVICSDGHIFGDLIGVPDEHIDAYSDELRAMIAREGLSNVSTFDLREVYGEELSHDAKRAHVLAAYGPEVDQLRQEVLSDDQTARLYCGITRFLVEDTAGHVGSKSALQRECRRRAYGVIQRSRAWGELVAARYPRAVRLSIHPQPAGAAKFGIRLLNAGDAWTTPWHSVLVHREGSPPQLMRRVDAVGLGRVVEVDGRLSHVAA